MSERLRPSGLNVLGDVAWGTHFCQFYQSAQDLLDILVPYFAAGLENNEFCMWITSEPLGAEAARQSLAAAVPNLDEAIRRGQIEILPHTEWYLKGGVFDSDRVLGDWIFKLDKARAAGFDGLRLSGNTFWLEQKDWRAFTEYEAAVDGVIGQYRMLAACTYSVDRCDFNEILDVVRNHRFALVRREGGWELIESAQSRRAYDELKNTAQFPEQNPNPVLRLTVDGKVLYANPAARAYLAAGPDGGPLTASGPLRQLAKDASGQAGSVETELEDGRGRAFWIAAIRPAGESYVNLYFRDVTKRKIAEETLRQSEEKYRALFENMSEGFALSELVDGEAGQPVDWRVLEVNDAYTKHMGLARDRVIGRRASEFLPSVQESLSAVSRVVETQVPASREIFAAGLDRHLRISTFPAGGRRFASTIVDITEAKRLETERKKIETLRQALADQERLRLGAAVEQASDAVVMIDLDGTIRYVNASFEAINRIGRGEAAGRSYLALLGAGTPAEAAVRDALAKGLTWHGQVTRPVPGTRPVELELTVSAAKAPSGDLIGGLVTEKDVTRENALQKQFRQAQKMEALGTLAGGITHDFNNILGAIVINAELALMDLEQDHPSRAALPAVLQAAERGKELVKQIITFSRQREWTKAPLEIAPAVADTMGFLRSTLPKDVVIHESIAPDSGVIMADPSQIHQIVVNLCQNAALAMRDGGGTLDVKLGPVVVDADMAGRHPDLKPGRFVRLTVADTGCGMTPEILERIFEPFYTTRGHGGGSGLGLPVVLGVVKSYDGAVVVYSEPGKGSVFNVYIPRYEGEAPAAKPARLRRLAGDGERILLVEDEPVQRQSLARSLTKLGYRVTARASGRSALTLFRKDPAAFDAVITDQTMPGMSGLDLAAAIQRTRPVLPVILCTGFSEKVNGSSFEKAGIREYIMKPFTLQEISRVIAKALGKSGGETPSS